MKRCILYQTLVVSTILLFTSCQKDDVFSDLQIIENNLKSFIEEQNIQTCSIVFLGEEQDIHGPQYVPFDIENGFLVVQEETPFVQYNLLHLLSYYQYDQDMKLYFSL